MAEQANSEAWNHMWRRVSRRCTGVGTLQCGAGKVLCDDVPEAATGEEMQARAPLGERVARWSIVAIALLGPLVMSRLIGIPP